jgi:lipopolysaccharide transport protein LptA
MARIFAKLALLLAAWALPALAVEVPGLSQLPVTVDAASSEVDYKTNTVVFTRVTITQGDMRVQAERAHATGLNFANSKWNFDGNVHIDAGPRGNLRSDQAIVEFRDNHIARATITGKPAEFEQKRENSLLVAHGHADEILYDVSEGTVRMLNDAWLSDGQNEISGPLLVYNIREQRIQAAGSASGSPAAGSGVRLTITPRSGEPGKPEAGKPEAAKPAPNPPPTPEPNPHP